MHWPSKFLRADSDDDDDLAGLDLDAIEAAAGGETRDRGAVDGQKESASEREKARAICEDTEASGPARPEGLVGQAVEKYVDGHGEINLHKGTQTCRNAYGYQK